MKSLFVAASLFTAALTAAPAMADSADVSTCRTLAQQVASALSASGDATEARAEQRQGTISCSQGFYANGASHYRKALTLLGK